MFANHCRITYDIFTGFTINDVRVYNRRSYIFKTIYQHFVYRVYKFDSNRTIFVHEYGRDRSKGGRSTRWACSTCAQPCNNVYSTYKMVLKCWYQFSECLSVSIFEKRDGEMNNTMHALQWASNKRSFINVELTRLRRRGLILVCRRRATEST